MRALPSLLGINKKSHLSDNQCPILKLLKSGKWDPNITIATTIQNADGELEYRTLGYEFFGTKNKESGLVLVKSNFAKELHNQQTIYGGNVDFMAAMVDVKNKINMNKNKIASLRSKNRKCLIDLQREIQCSKDGVDDNSCNKKNLHKIADIQNQIQDYQDDSNPWQLKEAFNLGKGYKAGAYYLKARPNSRRPGLYAVANMNGSTGLSLNQGGINNSVVVDNRNYTPNSQYFYNIGAEKVYGGEDKDMIIFRTYIASYNNLFLEPSKGAIRGFRNNTERVYLTEKPSTSWLIFLTKKGADTSGYSMGYKKLAAGKKCDGTMLFNDPKKHQGLTLAQCQGLCNNYENCKGISYTSKDDMIKFISGTRKLSKEQRRSVKSQCSLYNDCTRLKSNPPSMVMGNDYQKVKGLSAAQKLADFAIGEINNRCPKTHKYIFNGKNGELNCCSEPTFGDDCYGAKCTITPGNNEKASLDCCRTDVCTAEYPKFIKSKNICVPCNADESSTKYCSLDKYSENRCY